MGRFVLHDSQSAAEEARRVTDAKMSTMTETDRIFLTKAYDRALERGDYDDDVATIAQFLNHGGERPVPTLTQAMRAAATYFGRVAGVNP